jgi:hypothetical protein
MMFTGFGGVIMKWVPSLHIERDYCRAGSPKGCQPLPVKVFGAKPSRLRLTAQAGALQFLARSVYVITCLPKIRAGLVTLSQLKGLSPDADFVFVRNIPRDDKESLCY